MSEQRKCSDKMSGFILMLITSIILVIFSEGTYAARSLEWEGWWQKVQSEIYGGRLSRHDMAVVEKTAINLGITPDRVILTLLYKPGTPNARHMEFEDAEEIARYGRINRVYGDLCLLHRGVAYRLTHDGVGSYNQLIVGNMSVNRELISKIEQLDLPDSYRRHYLVQYSSLPSWWQWHKTVWLSWGLAMLFLVISTGELKNDWRKSKASCLILCAAIFFLWPIAVLLIWLVSWGMIIFPQPQPRVGLGAPL